MESTKKGRVNLAFDVVEPRVESAVDQKAPIIFMHGVFASKETWYEVIRPIADATGRKAYAYDARNHGDSGWSDEFDFENQQDDLLGFMDRINVKKPVLLGHSLGARTVMLFATNKPERVDTLVIEDMSTRPVSERARTSNKRVMHTMQEIVENMPPEIKDLDAAKTFIYDTLRGKTPEPGSGARPGAAGGTCLPLHQDETGKFYWKINFRPFDSHVEISDISVSGVFPGPTMILCGTESPFKVYEDGEIIRPFFPNFQFRYVEGAKHWIHERYPEMFVKEVSEFLNEC